MKQLDQMKEAHKKIYSSLDEIDKMLNDIEDNTSEVAKEISRLAGTLKVHLASEDRYLYPTMLKSTDVTLHKKAKEFQTSMGGLSQKFMIFKDQYNTQAKIKQNLSTAENDIKQMLKKINDRMHKEDKELYPLAEKAM